MSTLDERNPDLDVTNGGLSRRALLGRSLALGVAPLAVAAVGRPLATAAQGAPTGEIIISLGEPDTLLSGAIQSAVGGNIMRFIANGLTKLDQPSMEPVADLATEWQVSEDGKIYTFTLHEGVLWQDGQPFSVDDVVFSYQLWSHPEWPGPIDPNLAVIAGATDFKDGKAQTISGIEAVDATTVRFTLTAPTPSFLANAATWQLVPKH
ncbi:MAG TPA: ABC transporter substrate-binding protein, partial [Thermomicrobiales bacterium]|nr:ABC transporter substrate-binding protein [Thermomicrobiales bacterium]